MSFYLIIKQNLKLIRSMISSIKWFLVIILLASCAKVDSVTGEKVLIEPNPVKRAEIERDKGGGILGTIGGNNKQTTFSFGTSNVLWRATLKSLDFIPLQSVDYAGGVLVTDWYSETDNSNNFIKITVKFLSNDVKNTSIQVVSHKKICSKGSDNCSVALMSDNFSNEIKDSIIQTARLLKIEDEKKLKK